MAYRTEFIWFLYVGKGREPGIDYPAGFGVERSLECPRLHEADRPLLAGSLRTNTMPESCR